MKRLLLSLWEVDADSLRGKFYLLLLDKILLGAVIAIAIIVYDRFKTADQHAFEERMSIAAHELEVERAELADARSQSLLERQLEFERARLLGESLPRILAKDREAAERAHLVRAMVRTKSLDPETAVVLVDQLTEEGLRDSDFYSVAREILPAGMPAVARIGAALAEHVGTVGAVIDPVSGRETGAVPPEVRRARLWQRALTEAIASVQFGESVGIHSKRELAEHLYGLYALAAPGSQSGAEELSQSPSEALALVGHIQRLVFSPEDEQALEYVSALLRLDHSHLDNLLLAKAILGTLRQAPRLPRGPIVEPIAAILVERRRFDTSLLVQEEHWSLRFQAGQLLVDIMDGAVNDLAGQTSDTALQLTRSLGPSMERFRVEVLNAKNEEELNTVASAWDSGKLIRLAVDALGRAHCEEATESLSAVLELGDMKLRAFPFLAEDIRRALGDH